MKTKTMTPTGLTVRYLGFRQDGSLDAEGPMRGGHLTTDHAASSYGLPVLLDATGDAVNPSTVSLLIYAGEGELGGARGLLEASQRAGYPVAWITGVPNVFVVAV